MMNNQKQQQATGQSVDLGQVARDAYENTMATGGLVALRYAYLTDREQEAWRAAALAVQVATQEAGRDQPEKEQKQQENDAHFHAVAGYDAALQARELFARHWRQAYQDRPATLMEALELAELVGADFDSLVADGTVLAQGGMAQLVQTPYKVPDAPRDRADVLTDPSAPYRATGGQGDPAQGDGAGYRGPEKGTEGQGDADTPKTPLRDAHGQSDGYGAVGEGGG